MTMWLQLIMISVIGKYTVKIPFSNFFFGAASRMHLKKPLLSRKGMWEVGAIYISQPSFEDMLASLGNCHGITLSRINSPTKDYP